MEAFKESQLELALPSTATSYQDMLEYQKSLFCSQIDQLDNIVVTQCKLTGVNPLSQEMAAGALSIKIGKRPRDLLNPKAVKYMQEVFSIKDAITKKEIREISALFGVTATQVREFFTTQKSRVRKFVRLSKEKASRCNSVNEQQDGVSSNSDPSDPVTPVPLNSLDPVNVEEAPTCSPQEEVLPGVDESDKHFVENIFILMRKEETFSGQVKLMDWIFQVQNPSVLYWFLTKGGVMILATWLTQAAVEEQTSVLYVILKVLCHLPLQKALPVHMSAILQSVNKLRFYRASDISNRARILLARWSKMFARSQALKKSNGMKSANDVQDEMLLKQSINEVMGNDTWDSKLDLHEGALTPFNETLDNSRKFESPQPLKMLTASADDSNKKLVRGGHTRERRKVQLVEQPGQRMTGRSSQVTKSMPSAQGRPLSADDIQKAKMRAQFLQSKYGKSSSSSNETPQVQPESSNKCTSSVASTLLSAPKASVRPKTEDQRNPDNLLSSATNKQEILDSKMILDSEEPLWKRCKRVQILWKTPPGMEINASWKVGNGENSKEVEVQKNRIRREREIIYKTSQEIPSDPKEPWDREMDYDDSLTPEIPTEQLPDIDGAETVVSPREDGETAVPSASISSQNGSVSVPEPDLELLAVLLKNPDLVFALTSGQAGNLSSEETVKLLDMIKANELNSVGSVSGVGRQAEKVEVSLPSPTPSCDPVTSGWKNPFSRHNMPVSGEGRDAPEVHSLETLTTGSLMQPQIPASVFAQQSSMVQQFAHETVPQASMVQPSTLLLEHRLPPTMSASHQASLASSSNIRLPASEFTMTNASATNTALPNVLRVQSSACVMPSPASVAVDMPERHTTLPLRSMRTPTPPRPQTQLQPSYAPDPPHSHSWRERQGFDAVPYYHSNMNRNSYAEDVGGPMLASMHPRSWERNEATNRPEFESWSPENSPVRSREYLPQRNYMAPRMNLGHNYRQERSVARSPGYPPGSGYTDPNRGGNRRWRDRRR